VPPLLKEDATEKGTVGTVAVKPKGVEGTAKTNKQAERTTKQTSRLTEAIQQTEDGSPHYEQQSPHQGHTGLVSK
jgi:hypothetical protein